MLEFENIKPEVKINSKSRIDFVLIILIIFIMLKSKMLHMHSKKNNMTVAEDPDAVTERGQKHLKDLIALKKNGHGAKFWFTVGLIVIFFRQRV